MLPIKSNLGPHATALGYRVVAAGVPRLGKLPVVAWDASPLDATANDWIAQEEPQRSGTSPTDAWLLERLEDGPCPVATLMAAAKGAGMSWPSVRTSKDKLGVVAKRKGGAGEKGYWVWQVED